MTHVLDSKFREEAGGDACFGIWRGPEAVRTVHSTTIHKMYGLKGIEGLGCQRPAKSFGSHCLGLGFIDIFALKIFEFFLNFEMAALRAKRWLVADKRGLLAMIS